MRLTEEAGKRYDRAYYEKWYGKNPVMTPDQRMMRCILATGLFGRMFGRRIASILDVGCGTGLWREPLLTLNPGVSYLGIEQSRYAVRTFGKERNIRWSKTERVAGGHYDLILCVDVLHYLSVTGVRGLLSTISRAPVEGISYPILAGLFYAPVATSTDKVKIGDLEGFHARPASWYRSTFRKAGLVELGMAFWTTKKNAGRLSSMEVILQ